MKVTYRQTCLPNSLTTSSESQGVVAQTRLCLKFRPIASHFHFPLDLR